MTIPAGANWAHRILLNAVDVTALTALGATVVENERSSFLADFLYYPDTGSQDTDALTLQTVQIDVDVGSGWETIFSGKVIRGVWSPKDRRYAVRASTRIQEYFRNLGSTTAVLSALTGAYYSEALFGEPPEDLWEYAQLCMQTLEKDVYIDRTGTLTLVDWAAADPADYTLDGTNVHNEGAFAFDRPDADELINQVIVEYQYRVQRFKVRSYSISWSAWSNNTSIDSWCDWAIGELSRYQFYLPNREVVEGPLTGGSWHVPGPINFTGHPESGSNYCGVNDWVWVNNDFNSATYAASTGYRAFTQSIWETYTLTFNATAAQTLYGDTVTENRSAARDVDSDPSWPPEKAVSQDGWGTDTIGDQYEDQDDETARANDLDTIYYYARARIRGAQRGHLLTVQTDLRPDIDLSATVQVNTYGIDATGKVARLRYVLTAAPRTEVTIAISRGNNGSIDAWSTPSRPDTSPTHDAPASSASLTTYVGNWSGAAAAPDPDTRLGWITNVYGTAADGTNEYTSAFRVQWPEIETEAVEEVEAAATGTFVISVPHDDLTVL